VSGYKKKSLTTCLDYLEYMRMPLSLFPIWIQEQYNMAKLAYNGYVHLEMRQTMRGLPQAGILANKPLRQKNTRCLVITSMSIHQDYGTMHHNPFFSHWWSTMLGLNTKQKHHQPFDWGN
jgi:hypothetical protein